jgi:hypothetical protein
MAAFTAVDDPSAYFKVQLYTGDGSVQAITFDDTDTDMQPDFVWIKNRTQTDPMMWFDSVRGVTKVLNSNSTAAESTNDDTLTAFGSNGFTVGDDLEVNTNTETHVAWCWKESATSGFDMVAYTGSGSARTISHSLSAVPDLIIVKNRDATDAWQVYHSGNTAAPETDYFVLNTTAGTVDNSNRWNDTAPTSSVFSLGDAVEVNTDTEAYIAYCFTSIQGFSKIGSYVGNGNADAPFVYTGFRPNFLIIKEHDSTNNWVLWDSERNPINEGTHCSLIPNDTAVDNCNTGYLVMDFLSNGFKYTDTNAIANTAGQDYMYIAFAHSPFVNSEGVPSTAR